MYGARIKKKFLQDLDALVTLGYFCTFVDKKNIEKIKLGSKDLLPIGYPAISPVAVIKFYHDAGGILFQYPQGFVDRFQEQHFEKLKKHGDLDVEYVEFLSDPNTPRQGEVVKL